MIPLTLQPQYTQSFIVVEVLAEQAITAIACVLQAVPAQTVQLSAQRETNSNGYQLDKMCCTKF
jgi:hypothetical protein